MRRRRGYLWYLILLVLIIILGLELYLPRMAERRIGEIFRAGTDRIERLDIQVSSFPALEILLGRLDRVAVESRGLEFKGLYLDAFAVKYRNIKLKEGFFEGENIALDILITEEALNNYLRVNYPELDSFKIELIPDQVYLSGVLKFFEARLKLQLAGELVITEGNKISFIPQNFLFEDISISAGLIRDFMKDKGFSFDLDELDVPLNIDEIKIGRGELRIIGKGNNERKAEF